MKRVKAKCRRNDIDDQSLGFPLSLPCRSILQFGFDSLDGKTLVAIPDAWHLGRGK